ncbi:hypothetical protein [Ruminococcus sp.]|uniref:hypothetical protein n=1 Tax=Ruminococcus sp. TaxID=41978 RepID=UPI003EFFA1BD
MKTIIILLLVLFAVIFILYFKKKYEIAREKFPVYKNINSGNIYVKIGDCKIVIFEKAVDGIIFAGKNKIRYVREKSDFEKHYKLIK